MPTGLTQNASSGNQILAGLPREKYPPILFSISVDVIFLSVLPLNSRRSEFSFGIRRGDCPTYHRARREPSLLDYY